MTNTFVPTEELINLKLCHLVTKQCVLFNMQHFVSRSYSFLMKVTARLFNVFEKRSFKENTITILNLEKSENYWLRESMKHTSIALEEGKLKSLRPKLNDKGVIVISTRALKGMKSNYNADSFPILTYRDPLSNLWTKEAHDEDHSGITKIVAKSRRKFWIIKARIIAQNVKRSCYNCRLLDERLALHQMAPLPDCRLTICSCAQCHINRSFRSDTRKGYSQKESHNESMGIYCYLCSHQSHAS